MMSDLEKVLEYKFWNGSIVKFATSPEMMRDKLQGLIDGAEESFGLPTRIPAFSVEQAELYKQYKKS